MKKENIPETGILPNGIRIVHHQTDRTDIAHCGIIINAGSRDEKKNQQGLAHYIEHVFFKGTSKRKAFHILSRLDSVGGELNAYTAKEETCIYGSFLTRYFERAIEIISDIAFNSTFPEKEIQKEKDVIIDEIHSYLDNPSEQIFDDFEEMMFHGHPIGRNILGTIESIRSFSRKDIITFLKENYYSQEIVISSIGNIPFTEVYGYAEKYLSKKIIKGNRSPRKPFKNYKPAVKQIKKDTHQAHCITGNIAYSVKDKRRTGLILLNNLLGGPAMNSRLSLAIREKHGYTYNIESSYTPYSDTGIFSIYLGTDIQYLEKTLGLARKEQKKLMDNKLGKTQLHQAKLQLTGQIALSQEHRVNSMIALGKCILVFGKVDPLEKIYREIENVSAESILSIANEIFDPSRTSTLIYLPK